MSRILDLFTPPLIRVRHSFWRIGGLAVDPHAFASATSFGGWRIGGWRICPEFWICLPRHSFVSATLFGGLADWRLILMLSHPPRLLADGEREPGVNSGRVSREAR